MPEGAEPLGPIPCRTLVIEVGSLASGHSSLAPRPEGRSALDSGRSARAVFSAASARQDEGRSLTTRLQGELQLQKLTPVSRRRSAGMPEKAMTLTVRW